MNFWDNFVQICEDRGTKPTPLVKSIGLVPNKVTAWKNGSIPKGDVLVKLSQALDCTVMDFFSDDGNYSYVDPDSELTVMIEGYKHLSKSQQHRLLSYYYLLLEGKEQ